MKGKGTANLQQNYRTQNYPYQHEPQVGRGHVSRNQLALAQTATLPRGKDTYGSASNTLDHLQNSHTQTNHSPDVIRNAKGMYSQSHLTGEGENVPMERIITQSVGGADYFETQTNDQRGPETKKHLTTEIDKMD